MSYLEWSDDYSVHIKVIDNDHKALFDIVNALHGRLQESDPREKIEATFKALIVYVREHFNREEIYMDECGYPMAESHKEKHRNLSNTLNAHYKSFQSDPEGFDQENFLTFLKKWLSRHILQSDMHYVPYLRGEKRGVPEELRKTTKHEVSMLKSVCLQVPGEKVDHLKKCASILKKGGVDATTLEEILSKL